MTSLLLVTSISMKKLLFVFYQNLMDIYFTCVYM